MSIASGSVQLELSFQPAADVSITCSTELFHAVVACMLFALAELGDCQVCQFEHGTAGKCTETFGHWFR